MCVCVTADGASEPAAAAVVWLRSCCPFPGLHSSSAVPTRFLLEMDGVVWVHAQRRRWRRRIPFLDRLKEFRNCRGQSRRQESRRMFSVKKEADPGSQSVPLPSIEVQNVSDA